MNDIIVPFSFNKFTFDNMLWRKKFLVNIKKNSKEICEQNIYWNAGCTVALKIYSWNWIHIMSLQFLTCRQCLRSPYYEHKLYMFLHCINKCFVGVELIWNTFNVIYSLTDRIHMICTALSGASLVNWKIYG